jgi:hypothetical protein
LHNIERSLLCSILELHFVNSDEAILKHELNHELFTNPTHKLLVKAINRLRVLNEPITTDFVRAKLIGAGAWTLQQDNELLDIISAQPLGTYDLWIGYYKLLEQNNKKQTKKVVDMI